MLDQATLKEYVHYNPETGVFTRLKVSTKCPKHWNKLLGKPMGNLDNMGYLRAQINGAEYRLHRLAWLYMTGEWPPSYGVDHKNRNRSDNRWENLRAASQRAQVGNMSLSPTRLPKSGVRGVYATTGGLWVAHIGRTRPDGTRQQMHLGTFRTVEEAAVCRDKAGQDRYGEFYHGWRTPVAKVQPVLHPSLTPNSARILRLMVETNEPLLSGGCKGTYVGSVCTSTRMVQSLREAGFIALDSTVGGRYFRPTEAGKRALESADPQTT